MIGYPKSVIEDVVKLRDEMQDCINCADKMLKDKTASEAVIKNFILKRDVFTEFINQCEDSNSIVYMHHVIYDMYKPKMNGWELGAVRAIRERVEFHTARLA